MYDILGPDQEAPPTFWYSEREEHHPQGYPRFNTEPEDSFNRLLPEPIGWQEAPDPIRQSDYWDWGEKIRPSAHMRITENTRLTEGLWSDEHFHIGKLLGYLYSEMHQGGQKPVDIRGNLQPADPTTFGSLYEVIPMVTTPGAAYTSAGFDFTGQDGYPY